MGLPDEFLITGPTPHWLGELVDGTRSAGGDFRGIGSVGIGAKVLLPRSGRFKASSHGLEPHDLGHARAV